MDPAWVNSISPGNSVWVITWVSAITTWTPCLTCTWSAASRSVAEFPSCQFTDSIRRAPAWASPPHTSPKTAISVAGDSVSVPGQGRW
jgi:hypothetical protein